MFGIGLLLLLRWDSAYCCWTGAIVVVLGILLLGMCYCFAVGSNCFMVGAIVLGLEYC